ncbi:DUF4160 domain-containing protein [Kiritimatiella glycovorans]|uniref:Uncharacterized protein n=1 Tax=Kiritimatiella glycovorans TaxID=1307763 RepID=A0A0G3EJK6_9BACT|nr:hypothetical protein L21SP4_02407 [Kiritimatiella glycovorans]
MRIARKAVGNKAIVDIETLALIGHQLPPCARGLVIEWASIHQDELREGKAKPKKSRPARKADRLLAKP